MSADVSREGAGVAEFRVSVLSISGGLAYQWRRNGQDLPGKTDATLEIGNAQEADEGIYDVALGELTPTASLTLNGVTLSPLAKTSQAASLLVDGASALTIHVGPKGALIPLGGSYTLSVTAMGPASPALTYQWRKGGVNIGGATKGSYTIAKAALTHAGAYTCVVKSGATSVTSSSAEIGVADPAISKLSLSPGGYLTKAMPAAGNGLSYRWTDNSAKQTLVVGPLQAVHEGLYTCTVTGPAGDQITGGVQLYVSTAKPELDAIDLPPASIGQAYFYQIPVKAVPGASALTYSVTGLPPGMSCATATGIISGRPTAAKAEGYKLTLKATNPKGSGSATATLLVNAVPATAVGVFSGSADRSLLNDHLGGRFDLTTMATGTFSGSVTLGARAKLSFTSQLLQSSGIGDVNLRGGIPGLTLSDKTPLTATVEVSAIDQTAVLTLMPPSGPALVITAWRNPWSSSKTRAMAYAAYYTARLDAGMVDNAPQGYGFTSFTVAPTGLLTLAGKLADGTAITGGATVSKDGQIPIFSLLYANRGSHVGSFTITPATLVANNQIEGAMTWLKPAPAATSADTVRIMGLPVAVSPNYNAKLSVAFNGLGSALDFDQPLRITNPSVTGLTNTVTVITPVSNTTTMTTLDAKKGLFSGAFAIRNGTGTLVRPAPYFGQIVKINGVTRGYGYYLLPTVPIPPKTVATSPKVSGRVILDAAP